MTMTIPNLHVPDKTAPGVCYACQDCVCGHSSCEHNLDAIPTFCNHCSCNKYQENEWQVYELTHESGDEFFVVAYGTPEKMEDHGVRFYISFCFSCKGWVVNRTVVTTNNHEIYWATCHCAVSIA